MFSTKFVTKIAKPFFRQFSSVSEKDIISRLEVIEHNQHTYHKRSIMNNLFMGFFFIHSLHNTDCIVRIECNKSEELENLPTIQKKMNDTLKSALRL